MIRLQKILSAAGVASRRAAEALIRDGRVAVNGTVVRELGTRADPERDVIRVDDRRVRAVRRLRYLLLNKPRGCVTTRSDPQGRRTVLDLLKGVQDYVYPVGRLDYDSEGLLLLTNDGELAARLMHPRHEVERVYDALVRGVPSRQALERLAHGLVIDGRRTRPAGITLVKSKGARPLARSRAPHAPADSGSRVVRITLREGRSRQVRKMCEAIGHPVVRLRRVRIGPITDERLRSGEFRELTAGELAQLKAAAGLPGATSARQSSEGMPF
jgi:23S rRNA pseudouridine2605 synthase